MPTLSRSQSPVRQTGPSRGPAAGPAQRPGRGNAFAQDQLRATQTPVPDPTGDYVTMAPGDKAGYLAQLFATPGVKGTFDQRGFDGQDQRQLAAVMQNEGGLNERRRGLASHYSSAANHLVSKLAARGHKDLAALAGVEADPKLNLTEDERAVLTAAQQGQVDLAALRGEDRASRDAAKDKLTEVGIGHQSALFDEYSGLANRQRGGEKLGKQDLARLGGLQGRSLQGGGDFSDARGISSARFRGLYKEGQTRFEAERFASSRNKIERWIGGGERGEGGEVGVGGEAASRWVGRHPEAREGNMDALADAETSWGTAQIMGHYADRGDLHKADGSGFTMDDMRAAADRRSPDGTDVDMQISYFRDIAGVQGHLGSAEEIAVQYNGPAAPPSYAAGLNANASRYDRAVEDLPGLLAAPGRRSDLLDTRESVA